MKPQKATSSAKMSTITIPTVGVSRPEVAEESVKPPTTLSITTNPVSVAKFKITGIETR